jgi:pimeloyl-ACP methyl ester carboxylesterase
MSSNPTSHFVILPNRPIVQENGEIKQGPLKLHYWEWKGHQPTILFVHATSFHGRCYDRLINEALNGFHVIAIDLRGHGRSQQHPPPCHTQWLGEDLLHFIETLNLSKDNLIGIAHSKGGSAITNAAAIAPKRVFRSLLLFDPSILPRSYYGIADDNKRVDAIEHIRRRKNQWSSIEDMISSLEKRQPFSQWPKDTLRNYCTYGLDENCRLICTAETEHSLYQTGLLTDSDIYALIEQSKFIQDIPIHIVRSSLPFILGQFDTSPTEPTLVKWFKKGRDTKLENVKHFFPMEQPQLAIDLIKQHIKEDVRSNL